MRDIENGSIKFHTYIRWESLNIRNAKDSYVIDIRLYIEIKRKDESMKINTDFVERILKNEREEDKRLSPSRSQVKYLVNYTEQIHELAKRIEVLSNLAHEGIISFEEAQKQLHWPTIQLKKNIQYVYSILEYEHKSSLSI